MASGKQKPQYMVIYRCKACKLESGYTELDVPKCRYCEEETSMELISKQELTPEVMADRLKAVSDSMMKNLESAYQSMPDDKDLMGDDKDAEEEMLKLLAMMQKLRDQIHNLELKNPDEKENRE
jgi:hypothetical protein